MEKAFSECFANMYLGKLPDAGMRVEFTPNLTRYIGAGREPFDYSITSQTLCSPEEFRDQVRQEIQLAESRSRATFEWKVFETLGMPFQTQILAESNFFRRRTARLRFCQSDFEATTPESVFVKRVSTEADFETLLDVNEAAFGSRSLWLRESLGLEIKLSECSPDSDRVLRSLGFTDGGIAEKWIYPAP
jgi:hypothetical protein